MVDDDQMIMPGVKVRRTGGHTMHHQMVLIESGGKTAAFVADMMPTAAHAPDAWIDEEKTKVGYEIPFNRHFYVFKPPRPLAEIDAELKGVTDRILAMIGGLTA